MLRRRLSKKKSVTIKSSPSILDAEFYADPRSADNGPDIEWPVQESDDEGTADASLQPKSKLRGAFSRIFKHSPRT